MKNKFFKRISFQISFAILSAVLTITACLIYYNHRISEKALLEYTDKNSKAILQQLIYKVDGILSSLEAIPQAVAPTFDYRSLDLKKTDEFLTNILQQNDLIFGTALAFTQLNNAPYKFKEAGKIVSKNLHSLSYNYKEQDWFLRPIQEGHGVWIDPYFDKGGGEIFMTTYALPVTDKTHKVQAVLTIDISLEWLQKMISTVQIQKTGYAFLINRDGLIIAHPNVKLINKKNLRILSKELNQPYLLEIAEDIKNKKGGVRKVRPITIDKKAWIYYAPLQTNDWSLAIIFPEDELYTDLNKLNRELIFIGVLGFILLFIIIVWISERSTKQLRKLAKATAQIGKGNLDIEIPLTEQQNEVGDLTTAFSQMKSELKNYIETTINLRSEKEKTERDLHLARSIQEDMLPKLFPPFPLLKSLDVFAHLTPAKEVGGDLFDFSIHEKNKLYFVIGDVSGKGIPASLYMAMTLTLFRALRSFSPSETLRKVNSQVASNNPSMMFVTFFMGVLDLETGKLTYSNAGHNPPYLLKPDGSLTTIEGNHGLPLGISEDSAYQETTLMMSSGDMIVLYSDGVTEAQNTLDKQYGQKRFENILRASYCLSPKSVIKKIVGDLQAFCTTADPFDDLTLQVIAYYGNSGIPSQSIKTEYFKNEIIELRRLEKFIKDFSDQNHFAESLCFKLNLVLDEFFTNIVNYAFKEGMKSEVKITISLNADEIRLMIEDKGKPFDPTLAIPQATNVPLEERALGGLGIQIAKEFMNDMSYRREDDTNILVLSLIL